VSSCAALITKASLAGVGSVGTPTVNTSMARERAGPDGVRLPRAPAPPAGQRQAAPAGSWLVPWGSQWARSSMASRSSEGGSLLTPPSPRPRRRVSPQGTPWRLPRLRSRNVVALRIE
jgi:hypothetical protein